jgi:hypothetical protein
VRQRWLEIVIIVWWNGRKLGLGVRGVVLELSVSKFLGDVEVLCEASWLCWLRVLAVDIDDSRHLGCRLLSSENGVET